jgi:hypothetical protein
MTDSTNNSFEEQWQHAFDNTELTPPESVWEKIELGLKPENTLPSKPNFGNKPYYFLGGILVGILGLFLWFNNTEKQVQVVGKEEVKTEKLLSKIDLIFRKKILKWLPMTSNIRRIKSSRWLVGTPTTERVVRKIIQWKSRYLWFHQ